MLERVFVVFAMALGGGVTATLASSAAGNEAATSRLAPERFRILFLDVGGMADAEHLAEAKRLAECLRYKLEFDYLYRDEPAMSRAYPALEMDRVFGPDVGLREVTERARRVDLVTDVLTSPQQFAELLAKYRPNVVHVLAHGAGKGAFEEASWSDHGGKEFPLPRIQKALAGSRLALEDVCLVTPACDLGRDKILAGFRSMGFGCVIAWPGSVCASEALEFNGDLYEALVSQYVLHRGTEPFWSFDGGCPPALRRAFDFAVASLEHRYRLLDEHFRDVVGKPDVAGYYLHTPAWFEKFECASKPVLR